MYDIIIYFTLPLHMAIVCNAGFNSKNIVVKKHIMVQPMKAK